MSASQSHRLAGGGLIDRDRELGFSFNGHHYCGHAGDSLAAALLANGVHLVGRSLKYHRPRGIVAAGAEEPNAIVQLGAGAGAEPNALATLVELRDGLTARSVNAWPSVENDWMASLAPLSRLFAAGFYYKTFMAPPPAWRRLYEPLIRKAAGFGVAPDGPDPDRYAHCHAHCDVIVIGAGPAGLTAASTAAGIGARVILVDEGDRCGGSLLGSGEEVAGVAAPAWAEGMAAAIAACDEARILLRTTAFGYYDGNFIAALERMPARAGEGPGLRQRLWQIRARHVVLATGAHERPLVFADNDRPGVMLAGAAAAYVHRYAVRPGSRAVIATNNDGGYRAALALGDVGVAVAAVADARRDPAGPMTEAAAARGVDILAGHAVIGTRGRKHVAEATVAELNGDGSAGRSRRLACDLVAMSGGWSPVVHLFSQSRGRLRYDEKLCAFLPDHAAQAQSCAGALAGYFSTDGCMASGAAAGAGAARATGFEPPDPAAVPEPEPSPATAVQPLWLAPTARGRYDRGAKQFVDFQNDTTAADILLALQEGFESIEHVKRYTLAGFGTDQGKTANVNALGLVAEATGRPVAEVGTTTFRPPYTPVAVGALAGPHVGALLDPVRETPMHDWHVAHGALFENVGQWRRAWTYPRPGESFRDAVDRECLAVRRAVGVFDASTLGKIEIWGADSAAFLDRIYTNGWSTLPVGRARYGLMCREDGMVFDDGTTTRLDNGRYFMTTTSGNAAAVLDWLEEWSQTEWPELEVYFTSVTEQWATVTIAGPGARELLAALAPDLAVDRESFPFMALRQARVAGIEARILRISFSGELSYEMYVPWWHGLHLWEAAMAAGAPLGATPYGTEAMHVLRAEKGYIVVGHETDGTVTPLDLGMAWAVSKKKDFIGRRSLSRADTARPDRKQLVGLKTHDPARVVPEGAQLVSEANLHRARKAAPGSRPVPMEGHVSSSYHSAALGRSIALALVKGGSGRWGETLHAAYDGVFVPAEIVSPVFYDPGNERRDA